MFKARTLRNRMVRLQIRVAQTHLREIGLPEALLELKVSAHQTFPMRAQRANVLATFLIFLF